jgi:hypothetical protein
MDLRRIDPDDPRFVLSDIPMAVRQIGLEEEGIARRHQVGRVINGQLDRSGHEVADRFALMRDEVDLPAARRHQDFAEGRRITMRVL